MGTLFDIYIAVDWSARNTPSPNKPSKDSIWVGEKHSKHNTQKETYFRTRSECIKYLETLLQNAIYHKKRVLVGYDFDFGFPAGFATSLSLQGNYPPWKLLWDYLTHIVHDNEQNNNNRFEVAAHLNSLCINDSYKEVGPLWGCPTNQSFQPLHPKSPLYPFKTKSGHVLRKSRWTELRESKTQPVWKLIGTASVGGQTLIGIPMLNKLRNTFELEPYSKIWPFETGFNPESRDVGTPFILHVEIWPGILSTRLDSLIEIRDQAQVRATVGWIAECDRNGTLSELLGLPQDLEIEQQKDCIDEEGWVLGSGYSKTLSTSASRFVM